MSSVSDWDRKRTLDAMFANVSPQFREQFIARQKVEQDKMDKEQDDKEKPENDEPSFLIQAPDDPLATKTKPENIKDDDDPTARFGGKQAPPFKKKEADDKPAFLKKDNEQDDDDEPEEDGQFTQSQNEEDITKKLWARLNLSGRNKLLKSIKAPTRYSSMSWKDLPLAISAGIDRGISGGKISPSTFSDKHWEENDDIPFVKSREQATTGVAQVAGEPHGDDTGEPAEADDKAWDKKANAILKKKGLRLADDGERGQYTNVTVDGKVVNVWVTDLDEEAEAGVKFTVPLGKMLVAQNALGAAGVDYDTVGDNVLLIYKKDVPAASKALAAANLGKLGESLTAGIGLITPKPMMVGISPGTEVVDDPSAFTAITSSGTDNGHTHMAYYDSMGNGTTSFDDGHSHTVRSFIVGDYQSPDGGKAHSHSGALPRPEETPGSQYQPYDGVMREAQGDIPSSLPNVSTLISLAKKHGSSDMGYTGSTVWFAFDDHRSADDFYTDVEHRVQFDYSLDAPKRSPDGYVVSLTP